MSPPGRNDSPVAPGVGGDQGLTNPAQQILTPADARGPSPPDGWGWDSLDAGSLLGRGMRGLGREALLLSVPSIPWVLSTCGMTVPPR